MTSEYMAQSNTKHVKRPFFVPFLTKLYTTPWIAIICVVLLAPLGTIGRNFWTDEAFTASYTAHTTLAQVYADGMRNEGTPALYFTLIWYWSRIFGNSEIAIRSFSVICAILAVWLFHRLSMRLFTPQEAGFLSILLACVPLVGQYIVEARVYTFALLVSILHLATFIKLLEQPSSLKAMSFSACTAILVLYTIYFGAILVVAQSLFFGILLLYRRAWRAFWHWCVSQLVILLTIVPSLPWLFYQLQIDPAVGSNWVTGSDYYWFILSLIMYLPAKGAWFIPWMITAGLIWAFVVIGIIAGIKQKAMLSLWSFILPGLFVLLIIMVNGDAAPRYLIVLLPGALFTFGIGLRQLYERRKKLAQILSATILLLLIVLRVPAIINPSNFETRIGTRNLYPWTKLIPIVEQQAISGDVIVLHPPWDQRIFEYYAPNVSIPLLGAHHYDTFYYYGGYPLRSTWNSNQLQTITASYKRIWIFQDPLFHQAPTIVLPYHQVNTWKADGMTLTLYER